ncbi:DUF262 domain-containing protein [Echinimonas agarilytica]|uniref:DUF262 domain-containing HNH endonuclease family protein n=1 Tax=Echinimonas agarilytica TaxID=1215918 RepID=A0AA42B8J8_9GAMM|nr:DUF262 domain-containing protein [Echinimonas agarilytica]MCM2680962.1 DUF262 domain-containing HNH endonuclease family protein [Echinimonas agarilytica]
MSNDITSFSVKALLMDSHRYLVPMYQRNYAWGEGEINQLVQDVLDYQLKSQHTDNKPKYYIGTLVVYERKDGSFEVIDGQQRFTTLTLLAFVLKRMAQHGNSVDMTWYNKANLSFESRVKSSITFACLMQGIAINDLKTDDYNQDVINGFELLEKALGGLGNKLTDFCTYLFEQVQITRVSVPKDTDLNHYFEVMNNRGEQLEKHEVVKARLMAVLNEDDTADKEQSITLLNKVWDATANMERYVQYGFTPDERHSIFGRDDWGKFTPSSFDDLLKLLQFKIDVASGKTQTLQLNVSLSLNDILQHAPQSISSTDATLTPERFNSVINFSNFLLHVLRVLTKEDVPLDDKQLLDQFQKHVNSVDTVKAFIFALLKCKYLFDQFIIKREFSQGEDKWSLKRLHFYSATSQSYINTFDKESEDGFEGDNRRILMLLAALHVSTPTLVYKHWLNAALFSLYSMDDVSPRQYLGKLEHVARQFVFGRFLSVTGADYFDLVYRGVGYEPLAIDKPEVQARLCYGAIENNLVFNYLDYLIWCEATTNSSRDEVLKQFEFSFRSSVEHFYPQHPLDGHKSLETESLHRFGNLCLISHSKNSKLSNVQPAAKRDHFKAAINGKKIDTLKLYKMISLLAEGGEWEAAQIKLHENSMIKLLVEDSKRGAKV